MPYQGNIILINPSSLVVDESKTLSPTSPVNLLLNFLKSQKVSKPYKFSYSTSKGVLIDNLNLKDNLKLENLGHQQSNLNIQSHLDCLKNIYLNELFKKIGPLELLPEQVDAQTQKLTSLVKCFLAKADYLFFEYPEHNLDHQNLVCLAKAMQGLIQARPKNCLVFSDKISFWSHYASHNLLNSPSHGFNVLKIEKKELMREINLVANGALEKIA